MRAARRDRGAQAALASAVLFGAGTPVAKLLLGGVSPWLLAGLLYCGSGLGLSLVRLVRKSPPVRLHGRDRFALAGALGIGGVVAPVLLLAALSVMPASGASLLLNAEAVFTAVLAWVVFRENTDRRVLVGMVLIVAGAVALSVPGGAELGTLWPMLAVLAACTCWGLDNNLTGTIALVDAAWLAAVKGLVAGPVNIALAILAGARPPDLVHVIAGLGTGFLAYGVSLVLFITALRHVGIARAGAYYAVAPFFGALLAVVLGAPITASEVIAGTLMGVGVWLHLTERHEHTHEPLTHTHRHTHDDGHHRHEHTGPVPSGAWHRHEHAAITHTHAHYPDAHHRHRHPFSPSHRG